MPQPWEVPKPPGYQPGQSRGYIVTDICTPVAAFAIFLACLRFYVRAYIVKAFGKDDWLLLAAVVLLCGYVCSALWQVALGAGRHLYDLNQGDLIKQKSVRYLVVCTYLVIHVSHRPYLVSVGYFQ